MTNTIGTTGPFDSIVDVGAEEVGASLSAQLELGTAPLPRGWRWVRVADVGHIQLGRQRAPKHHFGSHMRPYLRVANVFEDRIDVSDVREMNFTPAEFETYRLKPGDMLLNEGQSRELVGRPAIYRDEIPGACFQNTLIRFRANSLVEPKFALMLFRHYLHSGHFQRIAQWTTNIAHLGAGRLAKMPFPLPPIEDQGQIVAEIEKQFTRIDSAIEGVRQAQAKLDLYRTAVLEEAIRGQAKAELPSSPIGHVERLPDHWVRELPAGWRWTTLGAACAMLIGFAFRSQEFSGSGIPLLRGENIQPGSLRWDDTRYWPTEQAGKYRGLLVEENDVILAMDRPLISSGLKLAMAESSDVPCLLVQRVARLRPTQSIVAGYIYLLMQTREFMQHLRARQTGTQLPHVSGKTIESFPIPLPPKDEQERIVKYVGEVFASADRLKAESERSVKRAQRLRVALLASAFTGRLVSQNPMFADIVSV